MSLTDFKLKSQNFRYKCNLTLFGVYCLWNDHILKQSLIAYIIMYSCFSFMTLFNNMFLWMLVSLEEARVPGSNLWPFAGREQPTKLITCVACKVHPFKYAIIQEWTLIKIDKRLNISVQNIPRPFNQKDPYFSKTVRNFNNSWSCM